MVWRDPCRQIAQLLAVFYANRAHICMICPPQKWLVGFARQAALVGGVQVRARCAVFAKPTAVGLGAWTIILTDTMIRLAVAFSRLAEAVHDGVLGEEATVLGVMIDINMIIIKEKQRNGWACPRTPSHGHPAAGVG